jgi:hypothetical protein
LVSKRSKAYLRTIELRRWFEDLAYLERGEGSMHSKTPAVAQRLEGFCG